jgi:hypothetical protein
VTVSNDSYDGVCDSHCSLRDAIYVANATAGDDVIEIPGPIGTITLSRSCGGTPDDDNDCGDLDIWDTGNGSLTIVGLGGLSVNKLTTSLSGSNAERLLHVPPPTSERNAPNVTIIGLTLRDGEQRSSTGGTFGGGCVANQSQATLTVNASELTGCARRGESGHRGGGAIDSAGPLVLLSAFIGQNYAYRTSGGGVYATDDVEIIAGGLAGNESLPDGCPSCPSLGGAVYVHSEGTVRLAQTYVRANTGAHGGGGLYVLSDDLELDRVEIALNDGGSGDGGGVFADAETVLITQTDVGENRADGYGGGMYLVAPALFGPFLLRSSFSENSSGLVGCPGRGGGLALRERTESGTEIRIENSTFAGNTAVGSLSVGGGIAYLPLGGGVPRPLQLLHVTLYGNQASGGREIANSTGGQVRFRNSILWSGASSGYCSGSNFVSLQYNSARHLASAASCALDSSTNDGDHASDLDPLTYYGSNPTKVRPVRSSDAVRQTFSLTGCTPGDQHNPGGRPSTSCTVGSLQY